MAANISKADGLAPIITFVSMIVLGIIISEFIVEDQSLQLPIILLFFFLGIFVAALELRASIGRRRQEAKVMRKTRLTDEEAKDKLARYVAELFEEDIPFDEMDAEQERKIEEMNEGLKDEDTETMAESDIENTSE